MENIKLALVSAGFEHGGNVTHRHLDGHPDFLVYPFESQLGSRNFNDFLASIERVQYRYPEFPEGLSPKAIYEEMIDEEMKTFLRKKVASKFKDADLDLDEQDRIQEFCRILGDGPYTRKQIISAFFISTFKAWKNYYTESQENKVYVGYSPAIGIDAERIIKDFPDVKIIHIIRNPFSAYRDTKRRPFPQPLSKYLITWNIYHSTVEMFAKMYPENVQIFRYEDLVDDKEKFMTSLAEFVGVDFNSNLLFPSWNNKPIEANIAPWGTVLRSTKKYNEEIIDELSTDEKKQIALATHALGRHFGYDQIDYLSDLYSV